ncbi:MAG: TonB-system energizer ExbB [Sulfurimonas sp.]
METILANAEQILDYGVIGVLLLMSVITFALLFERLYFYAKLKIEHFRNRDALEMKLTDNLNILSAIGANAPYIGLLGTVLGIMLTFYTLGDAGSVDAKKIMTSLALALKATAMGLIVAIPAIVSYTFLLRKVEKMLTHYDIANENRE